MTNSQNTKNEQQKDLCITSEQLTEQWKKGELQNAFYYMMFPDTGKAEIYNLYDMQKFIYVRDAERIKVLAEVPSYDELSFKNNELVAANGLLIYEREKNSKLKQQLAIAVEALDKVATYMTCDENEMREIYPDFCADQVALDTVNEAMVKIKELEK